jgi:hypothetical protein
MAKIAANHKCSPRMWTNLVRVTIRPVAHHGQSTALYGQAGAHHDQSVAHYGQFDTTDRPLAVDARAADGPGRSPVPRGHDTR